MVKSTSTKELIEQWQLSEKKTFWNPLLPFFFFFLQLTEILPSWYSWCKAVCVSPSPRSMGGHYRLSRVISWGRIQYLTLCSLTGPFPLRTPVLLSQPLTHRWNHWCVTRGSSLKEEKGLTAAAEPIKWCRVMWERSLSNPWLTSILLQSHSPLSCANTVIFLLGRWGKCYVVILPLFM